MDSKLPTAYAKYSRWRWFWLPLGMLASGWPLFAGHNWAIAFVIGWVLYCQRVMGAIRCPSCGTPVNHDRDGKAMATFLPSKNCGRCGSRLDL